MLTPIRRLRGLLALAPVCVIVALACAGCAASAAKVRPGAVNEELLGRYHDWIAEARLKHPYADSEQRMFDVMICESKGNASIVNRAGPYSGLFQYATATWNGRWNSYRDESMLDPRAQIFATAQAWEKRMQGQWGCYRRGKG